MEVDPKPKKQKNKLNLQRDAIPQPFYTLHQAKASNQQRIQDEIKIDQFRRFLIPSAYTRGRPSPPQSGHP